MRIFLLILCTSFVAAGSDGETKSAILSDTFHDEKSFEDITDMQKEQNKRIIEKYEAAFGEIVPDLFGHNQTDAHTKLVKKLLKEAKRRKRRFKRNCNGHKEYSEILTFLERKLKIEKRKSANRGCKKKDLFKGILKEVNRRKHRKSKNKKFSDNSIKWEHWTNENHQFANDDEIQNDPKHTKYPTGDIVSSYCLPPRKKDEDGTVKLCKECYVERDLGPRFFPRYINHIECGNSWPDDFYCFTGEGVCGGSVMYFRFLYDYHNVGFHRLFEWVDYEQPISVSCTCQILKHSIFMDFI